MPSLAEEEETSLVKALVPSDSGSGKTGALASLVDAGFNVRFLDFDGGRLSVLRGFVKNRANLKNVHFVDDLQDNYQLIAGRVGVKKASAFQRAMDALDKGGEEYWGAPIPPIKEWTRKDILVVDSLSMAGRASLHMVMQVNGAGMKNPEIQHYGVAMENIERLIKMWTSDLCPCHVIVNTHVTGIEGDTRLYPEALGSKLSPKVGRYFNNTLSIGLLQGQRVFFTKKQGLLPLKSAMPLPETLPIEDGWVKIFEALTGQPVSQILA